VTRPVDDFGLLSLLIGGSDRHHVEAAISQKERGAAREPFGGRRVEHFDLDARVERCLCIGRHLSKRD